MNAGRLRQRVAIQAATRASDGMGGESVSWSTLATVWAAVTPLSGREFLGAQGVRAELSTRVTMRYRSDVAPEQRLVWGSHTYEVQSVAHDEKRTELMIYCREML